MPVHNNDIARMFHSVADPDFMRFGVGQARRGRLEADHILNTRTLTELRKDML